MPFLLALLAGLFSAMAFQPLNLWPLMLMAFAVLIHLLGRADRVRDAAGLGFCFAYGQFALGLNWIATAFTFQAAMPAWLGWVAVLLLSIYLALFPMLGCVAAWIGTRRLGGGIAALTSALGGCWILAELARATVFTGFPWGPPGVVWLALPTAQAARWIGTDGLTAFAVLTGGGLLSLCRRRWLTGALLTSPFSLGIAALALPMAPTPLAPDRLIRVVQPNIGQDVKYDLAAAMAHLRTLARLSGAPGPVPRLLLWPEAATDFYLELDPGARGAIAGLLGPRDLVLLGGDSLILDGRGNVTSARNSLFALAPDGRLLGRYDKAHLVPYGEYLPMRPLLTAIGLSRLVPGDIDFIPGPGPRTLALPGFGKIGLQICYEIVFSGHVVDAADRPGFLFNPSNDAWFGRWGPPQHLAQARLRAIEEGVPIVRSTPTGISAIVDARGRVAASLPWRRAGAIEAAMPRALPPPPFARYGNLLPLLFAGMLFLGSGAVAVRERAR